MVDQASLDGSAVADGVYSAEGSTDDTEVGIDLESVPVVLVGEEGGDALREGVHCCEERGSAFATRRDEQERQTDSSGPKSEATLDSMLDESAIGAFGGVDDGLGRDLLHSGVENGVDLVTTESLLRAAEVVRSAIAVHLT